MPFEKGYTPHNKGKITVSKEEKKSRIRDYNRKYRKSNRETINKNYRKLYNKNTEKMLEYKRQWRKKHPETYKRWYQKNKKTILLKASVRAKKLRIYAIRHYSNETMGCGCCNEKNIEFLTIDHLPNAPHKRKNTKRGGREIFYWLKKNNYPQGFRILCMNCNFSRGKYGYCPHKESVDK